MTNPKQDEITQKERKQILRNDEAQTYLSRAEAEVGSELGGRFKHLGSKTTIVGASGGPTYPKMPKDNPWASKVVPDTPDPLGYEIDKE
jgi:hypothetical protein